MKFDFSAVDEHSATLGTIINSMETNLQNMQALKTQLLAEFSGAGASGYQDVMANFQTKLDAYNGAINNVKSAILETSSSQGLMRITDTNNGNRFMSIG
jgi:uncharacterized protein YukE